MREKHKGSPSKYSRQNEEETHRILAKTDPNWVGEIIGGKVDLGSIFRMTSKHIVRSKICTALGKVQTSK